MNIKGAKDYISLLLEEAIKGSNSKSEFKHCIEEGYIRFHHNSYIGQKLKELLNASIMPERPSDELLARMGAVWRQCFYGGVTDDMSNWNEMSPSQRDCMLKMYNALRAALLTPPKPKMKTVWKFSYTYCEQNNMLEQFRSSEQAAVDRRNQLMKHWDNKTYTNISPIWSEEVEDK